MVPELCCKPFCRQDERSRSDMKVSRKRLEVGEIGRCLSPESILVMGHFILSRTLFSRAKVCIIEQHCEGDRWKLERGISLSSPVVGSAPLSSHDTRQQLVPIHNTSSFDGTYLVSDPYP